MKSNIVDKDKIFIGRRTDNEVREFAIDISDLVECMDDTYSIACYAVAPLTSDEEAYPISSDYYRVDGNTLYWTPTNADTAVTGYGKFQVCLYNSDQLVNSLIFRTQIGKTLGTSGETPEVYENFLTEVTRLRDEAAEAAETAEAAVQEIEDLTATASVDSSTGTPSVTVTVGDPLSLDFAFHNLKGETVDLSDTTPQMDGTASAGTDTEASRSDHVHPHDEALLPIDTETGNPISITDAWGGSVEEMSISIVPQQDLNGYSNPWPAGGGKNLLNLNTNVTVLVGSVPSAVTITSSEGSATITEAYYDRNNNKFGWAFNVAQNTDYALSFTAQSTASITIKIYASDGTIVYSYTVSSTGDISITFNSSTNTSLYFYASITSWGQTINLTKVQIEKGSTATDYAPYSNICPITAMTEVEVTRSGDSTETFTIDLGQSVYGGTINTVTGEGEATMAFIESYNGETINEPWVSDRDAYASGTTPTTGAEVAYTLATPVSFTITPTDITLLSGNNTLTTDADSMEVTYKCTIQGYIDKIKAELLALI